MPSILDLIAHHEQRYFSSLNLVASENLVSKDVIRALASDLSMRYCIPPEEDRPKEIWDYPNQTFVREIARETERLANQLFHASYSDLRPLSGNQVAQIILTTLVSRGDTIWSVPGNCGGHFATPVIAKREGLNLIPLPYDKNKGIIDIDAASLLAKKHPPKLIFLDASMQLFPHPLSELRAAIGPSPIISYDASHTLGLIAGGEFQSPLTEGADLLHGSTHKSLWGPQKGLISVKEEGEACELIRNAIVPYFVSNIHVHHVAALGIALEESKEFGCSYACSVIKNAKALASSLADNGVSVLFSDIGSTESHQILVNLGTKTDSLNHWRALQSSGINSNAISLPFEASFGLRLGLSELTRRGLGIDEMKKIGQLIGQCIHRTQSTEKIQKEVEEISRNYTGVMFSRQSLPN